MMTVVDFTDVEDRDFEPVPRGQYLVEITGAEERDGQEYPYLNLELTIKEGPEGAEGVEDRKLWDILSYSPKALWKLKGFLAVVGYDAEDLAGDFTVDPAEYLGMEFLVQVTVGADREGTQRNRVTRYFEA